MPKSKFDAVLGRHKASPSEPQTAERPEPDQTKQGRGRPRGKRTNPDYQQATIYIPRTLHDSVKIALIHDGRREFSELVEELLTQWIKQHPAS
jgi:hypothetical protein